MANNCFVLTYTGTQRNLHGPMTFKEAIRERNYYQEMYIEAIVLKKVIDQLGREVK